jgi:hypothetical protein
VVLRSVMHRDFLWRFAVQHATAPRCRFSGVGLPELSQLELACPCAVPAPFDHRASPSRWLGPLAHLSSFVRVMAWYRVGWSVHVY